MSERTAKFLESKSFDIFNEVANELGHGTLPSICPLCNGPLDFGKLGEDELICRNNCGWKFTEVIK